MLQRKMPILLWQNGNTGKSSMFDGLNISGEFCESLNIQMSSKTTLQVLKHLKSTAASTNVFVKRTGAVIQWFHCVLLFQIKQVKSWRVWAVLTVAVGMYRYLIRAPH